MIRQFTILFAVASLASNCLLSQQTPIAIDPNRANVGGISIGSSIEKAMKAFGKPLRHIKDSGHEDVYGNSSEQYTFDGVVLRIWDNSVRYLKCTVPRYETADHVKVGSPLAAIFRVYGHNTIDVLDNDTTITYLLEESVGCSLTFTISTGRIKAIELFDSDD